MKKKKMKKLARLIAKAISETPVKLAPVKLNLGDLNAKVRA